ncbi:hypothetical protein ACMFL9_10505 (plasmid) [Sinorhizobium meliloti]
MSLAASPEVKLRSVFIAVGAKSRSRIAFSCSESARASAAIASSAGLRDAPPVAPAVVAAAAVIISMVKSPRARMAPRRRADAPDAFPDRTIV